ncbi:MAG: tRNA (adenosine(37)-N6)-dimethylallyltransferase MiaA [bacterium]|nr:tRNA (adenosine(37)-N6)-dimethylallyltransferase MiaA [bacterium]
MQHVKPTVVVIVGATGSGKSDLAVALAREFGGEIICADSRTIYREMDIGTAKLTESNPPPPAPPHHLLDIRNPDERYSVAEFKEDAERCIRDIAARGKVPIVVGGTMLYIRALVDNFDCARVAADPKRREELAAMSLEQLREVLHARDPHAAAVVDVVNKRRVIRAIETVEQTGAPLAQARGVGEPMFDFVQIGLAVDRTILRERIAQRTRAMFERGVVDEVRGLVDRYGADTESLRGVVYRQVSAWLAQPSGERDTQEALAQRINSALYSYARRQLTWFGKDARIRWCNDADAARAVVASAIRESAALR